MLNELDIQITNKCMFNCKHCCCSSDKNQSLGESIDKWIDVIHDAKKLAVQRIDITGGEPFLRNDIGQLVAELEKLEIDYEIQSTWVPKDRVDDSNRRVHVISMDGMKTNHDYYRGAGSFDFASKKLKELTINRLGTVRITTVVTERNQQDIETLLTFSGSHGVDHHAFFCFSPIGRGQSIIEDWIEPNKYLLIGERINNFVNRAKSLMPHKVSFQVGYSHPNGKWKNEIGCRAMGKDFLFVLADGSAIPCSWYINTGFSLGNVFKDGLASIYDKYLYHLIEIENLSHSACGKCQNYSICQGGCDAARIRFNSKIDPRCQAPEHYFPGCPEKKVSFYNSELSPKR